MQGVSWLGGGVPRWTLALLLAVLLWRSAGRRPAFLLAATALAANLASSLLKNLFDRPRPGLIPHLDHVSSWSYPHGLPTSVPAVAIPFALLPPPTWPRLPEGCTAAALPFHPRSRGVPGGHW